MKTAVFLNLVSFRDVAAMALGLLFILLRIDPAMARQEPPLERAMLAFVTSPAFSAFAGNRSCRAADHYRVSVIDNFDQRVDLVPEVAVTHGRMVTAILTSGRPDIRVQRINDGLGRGLARVIAHLKNGNCTDMVVSSAPGSNYTLDQVSHLLDPQIPLNRNNILAFRGELRQQVRRIAVRGFPSVPWMERAERAGLNLVKLKNDAVSFVLIEALGRLGVPVILPYGNLDSPHRGAPKVVNLFGLCRNALVYTALDRKGRRIRGYPYTALATGGGQALYTIRDCPVPGSPRRRGIDINDDGAFDFYYTADRPGGGCRARGILSGTSVIPPGKARQFLPPRP